MMVCRNCRWSHPPMSDLSKWSCYSGGVYRKQVEQYEGCEDWEPRDAVEEVAQPKVRRTGFGWRCDSCNKSGTAFGPRIAEADARRHLKDGECKRVLVCFRVVKD